MIKKCLTKNIIFILGCEREYLQQQPGGGCSNIGCPSGGSLQRRHHPVGGPGSVVGAGASELSQIGGSGHHHRNSLGRPVAHRTTVATHIHHHQPQQPQCSLNESVMRRSTSSSTSTASSRYTNPSPPAWSKRPCEIVKSQLYKIHMAIQKGFLNFNCIYFIFFEMFYYAWAAVGATLHGLTLF